MVAGKLIEFPRKLEWTETPCWVGRVKGTELLAKVEKAVTGPVYQWGAWNAGVPIGQGLKETPEQAMDAAAKAMMETLVVVRPLTREKA